MWPQNGEFRHRGGLTSVHFGNCVEVGTAVNLSASWADISEFRKVIQS